MVSIKANSMMASQYTGSSPNKSLYLAGFRSIETDSISSDISSEGCTHALVYKPQLLPNFQVENGIKGDHIATSVLLNFCEDIISTVDSTADGKQTVKQVQTLMNILKENSRLDSNIVNPSFPWNGMYTMRHLL